MKTNHLRPNKGTSLLNALENYVVIDTETTGLDPKFDELIEVAAVRVRNNEIVASFNELIKPSFHVDEFITELTGISNEMLTNKKSCEEVLPKFLDFLSDDILIGHNIHFDINFIYDNCGGKLTNDFVDTLRLSRNLFKQEKHHRLIDLKTKFNIESETAHRALDDVEATFSIYQHLINFVNKNSINLEELNKSKSRSKSLNVSEIKTTNTEFNEDSFFFHQTFVFTGTLETMIRKEAMQCVVDLGGFVSNGVTTKTNYLVLGNLDYSPLVKNGKSSKQKKAEALKLKGQEIEIISENVFYDMIEN